MIEMVIWKAYQSRANSLGERAMMQASPVRLISGSGVVGAGLKSRS
jgi:hypothetical protein